jgi:hypothetical protein
MPYIRATDKARATTDPTTPGELNFALTKLVQRFLANHGPTNYTAINAAVGALECCKLELYRRLAVPYEDAKITENGDVY